jgi:transitional endoplasmic reticulum ATPase
LAIHEEIKRDIEQEHMRQEAAEDMEEDGKEEEDDDTMPEILARHFEEAICKARRSMSDRDLAQYASSAQMLQQSRATISGSTGGSLASFAFPDANGAFGGAAGAADDDDEVEDLYS